MNADTPEDVEQGKALVQKELDFVEQSICSFKHDKIWTIREFILSDRRRRKRKSS